MAYRYPYDDENRAYQPPKLQTNRNMWKLMILTVLTLGIYGIVFFLPFSYDLDKIAPKHDGTKTMNFLFAYVLSFFTFSIVMFAWHYQVADRLEEALAKRQIDYEFSTTDFWGWNLIGSLILVGPFVYYHKLCKAMNLLCADYNERPVID